jgi:hypothetical protein
VLSLKLAAVGLTFVISTTAWLAGRPATVDCGPPAPPAPNVHRIAVSTIAVRPWYGPHHVYGIFVVPDRFNDRKYTPTLKVRDFESTQIRKRIPEKSYVDPTLARPGHYLKRVYVPTRIAAWFLLTGRFGDLGMPCHWVLMFTENTR